MTTCWHRNRKRSAAGRLSALALIATTAGCGPLPMNYLSTEGASADPVSRLGWGMLGISLAVVVIVSLLLIAAIFRRRDRPIPDANGRIPLEARGSQLYWIYIGVSISVVVLFGATVWTLSVLSQVMTAPSPTTVTVQINAHTWWWEARYLDGTASSTFTTANEIHVPVGQPVRIELTSDDVIHSFWVPRLAGKMDVIPGRTNVTWIQADEAGRYRGQCAEFCGLEHAHMAFYVVAEPPQAFRAWWTHQLLPARSRLPGLQPFEARCGACHSVRGTDAHGIVGPDLSHLATRQTLAAGTMPNDAVHLDSWIRDPQAIKPDTLMPTVPLRDAERHDIVAYLQSLE